MFLIYYYLIFHANSQLIILIIDYISTCPNKLILIYIAAFFYNKFPITLNTA